MATATADVATDKIALARAESNRDNAVLITPITGTVASMPFTAGHAMTTSDTVTIIGTGAVKVTIDVPETSMSLVKVGESAAVSVTAGAASAGKVTAIGILPVDSSTSSSASYPVTVTVPRPAAALAPGVTASVAVTVASARDVTTLPVSAVTKTSDTAGTVTTLGSDDKSAVTRVVLGATGTTSVQIVSGLTPGQRVVVADNTVALPTTSTSTTRRAASGGGGGGFGGGTGGAPPAGGPGR